MVNLYRIFGPTQEGVSLAEDVDESYGPESPQAEAVRTLGDRVTHYVFQREFFEGEDRITMGRDLDHMTLGYVDDAGQFHGIFTVLNQPLNTEIDPS